MSKGEAYSSSRHWLGSGQSSCYPTYQTTMLVRTQMHNHSLACRSLRSTATLRFGVRLESSPPSSWHGSESSTLDQLENRRLFSTEICWWMEGDIYAQMLNTACTLVDNEASCHLCRPNALNVPGAGRTTECFTINSIRLHFHVLGQLSLISVTEDHCSFGLSLATLV